MNYKLYHTNHPESRSASGPATRAFLTDDVCGQKFLVYYIESIRQVRIAKYGLSNDLSQFIFGAVTSLSAKDAAPLKVSNVGIF